MRWNLRPPEPYFFEAFISMTQELRRGAELLLELLGTAPPRVELVDTIHQAEHRCDQITHDVIHRLNKTFVTPIDVIKWKQIFDFLEDAADRAEGAAHVLESLYVKQG